MLDATMDSSHTLWLDILDHPVQIEFAGDSSLLSSARERAVEAWGELVLASPPVAPASPTAADGREEPAPLVFNLTEPGGIEHLLDQLSSRATLAGIEARSGELLMLHAAGLADPQSGRVVACVAPSGTGKTTLSRAAAGTLLYVTNSGSGNVSAFAVDPVSGAIAPLGAPVNAGANPEGIAATP